VTTVRDEGILEHKSLAEMLKIRDRLAGKPQFARLVSAGFMLGPPDGYGQFEIPSAAAARQAVNRALDEGADLIKFSVEDGYAGWTGLPVFDDAIINAIVETAHARGARVSVHVCDARYLERVLDAGVDDVAHIQYDYVNKELVRRLVDEEVTIVPTLTVLEAYGSLIGAKANLARFHEAGVRIALGNDYTLKPQNNFDHFELGMPMHEITRMHEAGMSPLAIITAATQNAARVCGLETELGTLEAGKIADALVVRGDPLADLNALTDVRLVVHNGEVIVNEP
jgi:imidazolonepropionase-like amidohydrolase